MAGSDNLKNAGYNNITDSGISKHEIFDFINTIVESEQNTARDKEPSAQNKAAQKKLQKYIKKHIREKICLTCTISKTGTIRISDGNEEICQAKVFRCGSFALSSLSVINAAASDLYIRYCFLYHFVHDAVSDAIGFLGGECSGSIHIHDDMTQHVKSLHNDLLRVHEAYSSNFGYDSKLMKILLDILPAEEEIKPFGLTVSTMFDGLSEILCKKEA